MAWKFSVQATVTNAGTIIGYNNDGVYMGTNGSVNNLTGGIITGGTNGVEIAGTGSVVNAGSIIGTNGDGVYMGGGGSVNNLSGGTNYGGLYGVYITGGAGYVTNAGTIIRHSGDGVTFACRRQREQPVGRDHSGKYQWRVYHRRHGTLSSMPERS